MVTAGRVVATVTGGRVILTVTGGIVEAVSTGSMMVIGGIATGYVYVVDSIVQVAQGGEVGAALGMFEVVGFVVRHKTVVWLLDPTVIPAEVKPGGLGGGGHGEGPKTTWGTMVIPVTMVVPAAATANDAKATRP